MKHSFLFLWKIEQEGPVWDTYICDQVNIVDGGHLR